MTTRATTCLLVLAAAALAGGGTWTPIADLVQPRQETGAARIGGVLYVAGGFQPNFPFMAKDTVEAYDIATDTWSVVTNMPQGPRDHLGVCAIDGKLIVAGGYEGDFVPTTDVWIYDPTADAWTEGADLPAGRGGHWMVAFDGKAYLFGGTNPGGAPTFTTYIYDPVADAWSFGAPFTEIREHLTATVCGDFVYVIGGRAGSSTTKNERYDPATDIWQTMAPMPTARAAMSTASLGGKVYVAGGETPQLFAVNEVYDPATDSWSTAAPMIVPRHGVASVALFDRIVVPAGGTVQGLAPTDYADAFVPAGHPWTDLGQGLAGVAGTPYLSLFGTLQPASPLDLSIEDGVPGGTAFLVVGASAVHAAFKGGVLVPAPDIVLPLPLGAGGSIAAGGAWPAGVPSGAEVRFQAWIPDPAGPAGFAASNAARATAP